MKRIIFSIAAITVVMAASGQNRPKLWYRQPANALPKDINDGWTNDSAWLNALPVGNGFLGAMVYGDVNQERIQLNEKTLWSGGPSENDNPEAAAYLSEIRSLLFAGRFKEATELTNKTQICLGKGSGNGNGANVPFGCFQTLGDLRIDFHRQTGYKEYYRDLDLLSGIASVKYQQNGVQYSREVFVSYPDRALIVRFTANKPSALSFTVDIDRPEKFSVSNAGRKLTMTGILDDGKGGEGMRYMVRVVPLLKGGAVENAGKSLSIKKATEVTLVITAATNYRQHYPDYQNERYVKESDSITRAVTSKSFSAIRQRHVIDFSGMMNRSFIDLGNETNALLPTDSLMLKNAVTKKETYLHALYYQYGRYLLLSSSRPGSLPANLQGVWANKIQTPWNGDYHTNINVQMNYWPAEAANLSECHNQLIDLIQSLEEPGTKTAATQYHLPGWVMHPITNVWGYTAPGEHPGWGLHVAAAAWLMEHVWDHFSFTRDTAYLRKVWPLLKSSCAFYLGWLIKDPSSGKLVSGPASSPENMFLTENGERAQISMGPSHDQEVIHELFSNTLQAAEILQDASEKKFIETLSKAREELAVPGIGADGRLMEWAKEYKEEDPRHRHTSHLYALYPGSAISVHSTPALAAAARKSLEARGDGGNGWSLAWKIAFWARLREGDHALQLLNNLLHPVATMGTVYNSGGGSYFNLFDACPPFQIDGNFGGAAGICEMLLQSQEGVIDLLPSLPSVWTAGKVKGLCARGGFEVDMNWKDNKLTGGRLLSKKGGECRIRYAGREITLQTSSGKAYALLELIQ